MCVFYLTCLGEQIVAVLVVILIAKSTPDNICNSSLGKLKDIGSQVIGWVV